VPEPAVSADAARMRLARQAARRREAITALRVGEAACADAASVLGNGVGPAEARSAALECAFELVEVAETLRRAVRLSRDERRRLAVLWTGRGLLSRREIADRLGVSERTVWRYLGRPGAGPGTS
jgi:DNA-directed RNA polymerase specialized sigma24 family protein